MTIEDTITEWLHARASKHLTVDLAKELAAESKTGWFVTNHGKSEFVVGKFAAAKYTPHHFLRGTDGRVLTFRSVVGARMFLADELKVLAPAIFDHR